MAEIVSLAVTIFLVWICLWFLSGTESFVSPWKDRPRKVEVLPKDPDSYKDVPEGNVLGRQADPEGGLFTALPRRRRPLFSRRRP